MAHNSLENINSIAIKMISKMRYDGNDILVNRKK